MKKWIKDKEWMKHWFSRELYMTAGIFIVALILIIIFLNIITRHNSEMEVPDFSGMTVEQAKEIADDAKLKLEVTDSVFLPNMARGSIFRQNPQVGSLVKKNRRILLTINSLQPKQVSMPSVTGFSLRQAKAELVAKQLHVGRLIYVSDMATNNVLSQKYKGSYISPGTMIETDSEIDLELGISSDGERTFIPDVRGLPVTTARDILIDNSLNIGRIIYDESVKNYSDSISGFVILQTPVPSGNSTYALGSAVALTVSVDKSKLDTIKNKED